MRNGLRDRVALRTDGGLQTGRDVVIAALLGAEEFGFGTAVLVAIGCDMARQCHLDTCPTGIATQREDLRAKFTGTPEQVDRFVTASPRISARSWPRSAPGPSARSSARRAGSSRRRRRPRDAGSRPDRGRRPWAATQPGARPVVGGPRRSPRHASPARGRLVRALPRSPVRAPTACSSRPPTARSAREIAGAIDRASSAGRSGSSCAAPPASLSARSPPPAWLRLEGEANDYVGKGMSGGEVVVGPEPDLAALSETAAIAGNTCLYGATGGRLHRRRTGGHALRCPQQRRRGRCRGHRAHGCEYMTGGTVVVLGPVGANFGAGMTGGRAYLYDPPGRHVAALHEPSVRARRLAAVVAERPDGAERLGEWRRLVEAQREAGSALAATILRTDSQEHVWLVEPAVAAAADAPAASPSGASAAVPGVHPMGGVPAPATQAGHA